MRMLYTRKSIQSLFDKGEDELAIAILKSKRNINKSAQYKFRGEYKTKSGVVEAFIKDGKLKLEIRDKKVQEDIKKIRRAVNKALREGKTRVDIANGNIAYAERYLESKGYKIVTRMKEGNVCKIEKLQFEENQTISFNITLSYKNDNLICEGKVFVHKNLYSRYKKKMLLKLVNEILTTNAEILYLRDERKLFTLITKRGYKINSVNLDKAIEVKNGITNVLYSSLQDNFKYSLDIFNSNLEIVSKTRLSQKELEFMRESLLKLFGMREHISKQEFYLSIQNILAFQNFLNKYEVGFMN